MLEARYPASQYLLAMITLPYTHSLGSWILGATKEGGHAIERARLLGRGVGSQSVTLFGLAAENADGLVAELQSHARRGERER